MRPKARNAVARSTTVLVLIGVVSVASISAFFYLYYERSGCRGGSPSSSTTGVVILADYLSVPSEGSYSSGSRDWLITVGNLGSIGIRNVCATLTTSGGTVTQTISGVQPDASSSVGGVIASGVQPGESYPVSFIVVYDNGDSQLLHSTVKTIATATSPGTEEVAILNDSLYLPSSAGTGTIDAFWTYLVGNTGTVSISSLTATPDLQPSGALGQSFLTNIAPGDEKSTGAALLLQAFNIHAGENYSVNFLVYYTNGQKENISTSVTAEAV